MASTPTLGATKIITPEGVYDDMPNLTAMTSGGFLNSFLMNDAYAGGVGFEVFDSGFNSIGPRHLANTYEASPAANPVAASLSADRFVVIWQSTNQDGSSHGVYGQLYSASGARVGSEFLVNTTTEYAQYVPSVTADGSGGFVVTWSSEEAVVSGGGTNYHEYVTGQFFDVDATLDVDPTKSGAEFRIQTNGEFSALSTDVARLNSGTYVSIWVSSGQDGAFSGVFGQRFDASGSKLGEEFQVNSIGNGDQHYQEIVALADGGFAVVWEGGGGYDFDIYARMFDADGTARNTADVLVSHGSQLRQLLPSVAPTQTGGIVVAWSDEDSVGRGDNVVAQQLNAFGDLVGEKITISDPLSENGRIGWPSMTLLSDGSIGVAWYELPKQNFRIIETATEALTPEADIIRFAEPSMGADTLAGDDLVYGSELDYRGDSFSLGAGNDTGLGGRGDDTILGGSGVDTLIGGEGNDNLDGGSEADFLLGGVGNDTYFVDTTFDLVDEGAVFADHAGSALDIDTIRSAADWFWDVYSVGEKMVIEAAAAGSDGAGSTLVGSIFSNSMTGNSGTNILFGRGGSDTYMAGDGIDFMSLSTLGLNDANAYAGVDGANTVIVEQRTTGPMSYDIIFEFEAGKDKIDVADYASVNGLASGADVVARAIDDGAGNSYIALGDGLDYVYMVGLEKADLQADDFIV